jgi:hypothetical protein
MNPEGNHPTSVLTIYEGDCATLQSAGLEDAQRCFTTSKHKSIETCHNHMANNTEAEAQLHE